MKRSRFNKDPSQSAGRRDHRCRSEIETMTANETELEMATRHVAEQEARIARQTVLIERIRKIGVPLMARSICCARCKKSWNRCVLKFHGFEIGAPPKEQPRGRACAKVMRDRPEQP